METRTLTDEPESTRLRLGRPYLRIAVVVAFAAGILGLGYFGPHAGPSASSGSPSPSESRSAALAPGATQTLVPGSGPQQLTAVTGLTQMAGVPGEQISWLPLQITSDKPALVGRRLFYVVGGDRIESSMLGSNTDPQTLVTTPRCQAINQLVAAGNYLLYVITEPAGPAASIGGCDTFGGVLGWTLKLVDLRTGASRTLAQGQRLRTSIDIDEFPIHVAATATAYAFDRPNAASDSGGDETVEVHSFDGRTLWTTTSQGHVADVSLGGDELAVVTQTPWPKRGTSVLWLANAANHQLLEISQPASSASLSADGLYLTWDLTLRVGLSPTLRPDIAVMDTASGDTTFLPLLTTAGPLTTARPVVTRTVRGPLVSWLATAPDGTVYPAFSWLGGRSGFLESVQQPVWTALQGTTMVWVAEGRDGWSAVAFEADLAGQ